MARTSLALTAIDKAADHAINTLASAADKASTAIASAAEKATSAIASAAVEASKLLASNAQDAAKVVSMKAADDHDLLIRVDSKVDTLQIALDRLSQRDDLYVLKDDFVFWRNILVSGILVTIFVGIILRVFKPY